MRINISWVIIQISSEQSLVFSCIWSFPILPNNPTPTYCSYLDLLCSKAIDVFKFFSFRSTQMLILLFLLDIFSFCTTYVIIRANLSRFWAISGWNFVIDIAAGYLTTSILFKWASMNSLIWTLYLKVVNRWVLLDYFAFWNINFNVHLQ